LNITTTLNSLTDVNLNTLLNGQYLTYDLNSSKWINSTLIQNNLLSGLIDVNISSVVNDQLLTYNGLTNKWVNFNKPSYTISEQTDFNNIITPTDLDFMVYNSTLAKWEPKTIEQEILNVFNGYCNIATITLTNIGGFIPLFVAATGYIVENFGDAFTVLSSTQLRVNRTNKYSLNMSWQPSTNQSNLRIYINGVLRIYSG
jgi:hypothetical protein